MLLALATGGLAIASGDNGGCKPECCDANKILADFKNQRNIGGLLHSLSHSTVDNDDAQFDLNQINEVVELALKNEHERLNFYVASSFALCGKNISKEMEEYAEWAELLFTPPDDSR